MIPFSQFLLLEGQLEKSLEKLGASEQEAKDAISRWRDLTPKQKEMVPNPQQYQELKTFMNDLQSAEKFVSNTAKQKQVKESGIRGLKKGEDYLELETGDPSIQAYAPLDWEASKLIASKNVGSCEGKWCTAYQKDSKYWKNYTDDKKGALIYFVTPETKYAALYLPEGYWQLFDAEDTEIYGDAKEKEFPLAGKMSKYYKQIRKHLPGTLDELAEEGDVAKIMKKLGIKNYKVRPDNIVDIDGDITSLAHQDITKFPVKFGRVSGNFDCSGNQIGSLEGGPEYVGGDFYCDNNKLNNLQGSPQEVGGNFHCSKNKLLSLNGSPRKIGGNFSIRSNSLDSLEDAPEYVGGNFDCSYNAWLRYVEGVSKYIGGDFVCEKTRLNNTQAKFEKLGVELKGKIIL